jgi:hypothetical protein
MEPFIQCNTRSILSVMDSMLDGGAETRIVFQLGKIPVSVGERYISGVFGRILDDTQPPSYLLDVLDLYGQQRTT